MSWDKYCSDERYLDKPRCRDTGTVHCAPCSVCTVHTLRERYIHITVHKQIHRYIERKTNIYIDTFRDRFTDTEIQTQRDSVVLYNVHTVYNVHMYIYRFWEEYRKSTDFVIKSRFLNKKHWKNIFSIVTCGKCVCFILFSMTLEFYLIFKFGFLKKLKI